MTGVVTFLREFKLPAEINDKISTSSNEAAYRAGLEDGREQAANEAHQAKLSAINTLKDALQSSEQTREEMRQAIEDEAGIAVATVIRALCPRLAELGLADAAHELISKSLQTVPRPIVVKTAQECAETLSEALGQISTSSIEIRAEYGLSASQIQIDWAGGSADIDVGAITSQILDLADNFGSNHSPSNESEIR